MARVIVLQSAKNNPLASSCCLNTKLERDSHGRDPGRAHELRFIAFRAARDQQPRSSSDTASMTLQCRQANKAHPPQRLERRPRTPGADPLTSRGGRTPPVRREVARLAHARRERFRVLPWRATFAKNSRTLSAPSNSPPFNVSRTGQPLASVKYFADFLSAISTNQTATPQPSTIVATGAAWGVRGGSSN